jgi:hypothetical protein
VRLAAAVRGFPVITKNIHSAAITCQRNSRTPPVLSLIHTAAMLFETGKLFNGDFFASYLESGSGLCFPGFFSFDLTVTTTRFSLSFPFQFPRGSALLRVKSLISGAILIPDYFRAHHCGYLYGAKGLRNRRSVIRASPRPHTT